MIRTLTEQGNGIYYTVSILFDREAYEKRNPSGFFASQKDITDKTEPVLVIIEQKHTAYIGTKLITNKIYLGRTPQDLKNKVYKDVENKEVSNGLWLITIALLDSFQI